MVNDLFDTINSHKLSHQTSQTIQFHLLIYMTEDLPQCAETTISSPGQVTEDLFQCAVVDRWHFTKEVLIPL